LEDVVLNEKRRAEGDDLCPPSQDVFFNMEIKIEDFGGQCSFRDATTIGKVLQRASREIERETEDARSELDFTVCPVPLSGEQKRSLRTSLLDDDRRRRLGESKSFTYKCGGQYNRCGNRSRQRLLNEALLATSVCEMADKANYAADIAETAFNDAEDTYAALKEDALACENMRAGQREVILTKTALGECRKELDTAQAAAKSGRQVCNQARLTSSVSNQSEYTVTAQRAALVAMGAAEKARSWLFLIESGFEPEVCGKIVNPEGITPQAVHDFTNMATFGAEMTATAVSLTEAAYLDLRQRAIECSDIRMAEKKIMWARGTVTEGRELMNLALNEAEKATQQLESIVQRTISVSELTAYLQTAKSSSISSMNAAEKAQTMYLRMQEELKSNVCGQVAEQGRNNIHSAETVCQLADRALFAADMASATLNTAQTSLSELMQKAVECSKSGTGQNTILMAKQSLKRCKRAHRIAGSQGKRAQIQCEKAKNTRSQEELNQCQQIAGKASEQAIGQAKRAESSLARIRAELDENVCRPEVQAKRSDISAAAVCQITSSAIFGASIASAAVKASEAMFSGLKDRVLDCYDLQQGQLYIDTAREVMNLGKVSQKMTSVAAKRARKLCNKARRASSEAELKGLIQSAEKLERDVTQSAETTTEAYYRIRDEFDGQFCSKAVAPTAIDRGNGEAIDQGPSKAAAAAPTGLNSWFKRMAEMLYTKISKSLIAEYETANLGSDCLVEGFNVSVRMKTLPNIEDRAFWITEESCSTLKP